MTSASLDLRQAVIDLDAFDQLLMCCDFAIANILRSRFLFIEFEHAKTNSIFSVKASTKAHPSYQWSRSFEHGFSLNGVGGIPSLIACISAV